MSKKSDKLVEMKVLAATGNVALKNNFSLVVVDVIKGQPEIGMRVRSRDKECANIWKIEEIGLPGPECPDYLRNCRRSLTLSTNNNARNIQPTVDMIISSI